MMVSRNEIETAAYRAALGVGLAHGIAEDAARIGWALAATRSDGLAVLLRALRHAEAHPLDGPAFERDGGRWRAAQPRLPSLVAGPAAADLRGAFPEMPIDHAGADEPAIMAVCLGERGPSPGQDGIDVPDDQWRFLQAFAARTYVPASEASRRQGAGPGMRDAD